MVARVKTVVLFLLLREEISLSRIAFEVLFILSFSLKLLYKIIYSVYENCFRDFTTFTENFMFNVVALIIITVEHFPFQSAVLAFNILHKYLD